MRFPFSTQRPSFAAYCICAALMLAAVGCARPGARPDWRPAPEAAPSAEAVLADIRSATRGLESFRASGRFILRAPELEAVQLLRQSSFEYRAPASLHVIGRKYSRAVFRLTADGEAYVLELPTEQQYYWSVGEDAGSPAAIAREMFFEAGFEDVPDADVTVTDYDSEEGRVSLAAPVLMEGRPFIRRLTATGPPWRVEESVLENSVGEAVAVTRRENYRSFEGVLLPTDISCEFPLHDTYMSFQMSALVPHTATPARTFDVQFALEDARRRGFTAIQPVDQEDDRP